MDLIALVAVLSLVYFATAAVVRASSKKEMQELERKKDLEIRKMRERLKKLSNKARRRRPEKNKW